MGLYIIIGEQLYHSLRKHSFLFFNDLCMIKSLIVDVYPGMLYPADAFSAEESPAAASEQKTESIKSPVIVLCIHGYLVAKEHSQKIEGSNKAMPQTPKEAVGMT